MKQWLPKATQLSEIVELQIHAKSHDDGPPPEN